LVERAFRDWEARRHAKATQPELKPRASQAFTVALSREAGTLGSLVALEVGRLLGWPVYDQELLALIAHDMRLRTSLLESVDERQQSWLLETAEAFQGDRGPWVTESAYVHHLVKAVLALGVHGECVLVGRGAPFILPAKTTLRVRLVGPEQDRIAELSRTLGISAHEAARKVKTLDRERNAFVKDHFLKDPANPLHYDLVLNAARLPIAAQAALIVETLRHLQARAACEETANPPGKALA
jgi:hypothetical protein